MPLVSVVAVFIDLVALTFDSLVYTGIRLILNVVQRVYKFFSMLLNCIVSLSPNSRPTRSTIDVDCFDNSEAINMPAGA